MARHWLHGVAIVSLSKEEVEDTYKQLQSSEVADLAYTVECEEDLAPGTLGHAALYLESADTSAV